MKKIIAILLVVVLIAGLGVGAYFLFFNKKEETSIKTESETNSTTSVIRYIEDEYTVGDKIVFDVTVKSNVKMTGFNYTLNNAAGSAITVTTGESKNRPDFVEGDGEYFIATGTEIIDTTDMIAGDYVIRFYTTDASSTRYQINEKPIVFTLKAVTVSAD